MAITTFPELQTAVANWLNRGDMAARIPELIELGDARIRRDQEWDLRVYTVETGGTPVSFIGQGTALPNKVRRVKDLWPTAGIRLKPLNQVSLAELRANADVNKDAVGTPSLFAILPPGDPLTRPPRLFLWPLPSGPYTVDFLYVNDIGKLATGDPALFNFAPDLYLWAALAESAPYLKHDERAAIWESKYQAALAAVNKEALANAFGASRRRANIRAIG
jgi:hypothetical protein